MDSKCIRECFFNGRLWKPGEVFQGETENRHFEKIGADDEEAKENVLLKTIRAALQSLDHEDNSLWTNQGIPQVKAVEKVLGIAISRGQIEDAFPGFKRDMKPLGKEKAMK
jgi:hypothetical protein